MSEEIKEILDEIRDSYYETQSSTKFYKNVKTIEEHITKLQNKVEELMTLYTTERNVKEDYKRHIEDAIRFIKSFTYHIPELSKDDLIRILQGDIKVEKINNIRTLEEYKEDVFDKLDEQQKLEWLYEMSTQINRAVEYIKYNATSNYFDEEKNMFRREIDLLEILGGSDKE